MDRDERRRGEGERDSPVARLERAAATGNWRHVLRRGSAPLLPSGPARRRHTRKRIFAVLMAAALLALLAALVVGPRLLNRGSLALLVLGLDGTRGHLADTILFVQADLAEGKVAMLAVPRETWIRDSGGEGHEAAALLQEPDGLARLAGALHLVAPPHRVMFTSEYLPGLVHAVGGADADVGPASAARLQNVLCAVLAKLRGPSLLWRGPRALWAAQRASSDLTLWQWLALGNCLRRGGGPELVVYPTRASGKRLFPRPEAAVRLSGTVSGILAGRVIVRNGADSPGLAGRVATQLTRKGFLVARPENTARAARTTVEGPEALSRQVQQTLGYGSCVYRDSKDVVVTIGLDAPNPE